MNKLKYRILKFYIKKTRDFLEDLPYKIESVLDNKIAKRLHLTDSVWCALNIDDELYKICGDVYDAIFRIKYGVAISDRNMVEDGKEDLCDVVNDFRHVFILKRTSFIFVSDHVKDCFNSDLIVSRRHKKDYVFYRQMTLYNDDIISLLSSTHEDPMSFAERLENESTFKMIDLHEIVMVQLCRKYNKDNPYPEGNFEYIGGEDTLDRFTYEFDPLWKEWFNKIKNIEKIKITD